MKYYAVTDDPRELYHYGVKGMKWGQHIFGDKPKSPGYKRAVSKLKANKANSRAREERKYENAVKKSQDRIKQIENLYKVDQEKKIYDSVNRQIRLVNKKYKRDKRREDQYAKNEANMDKILQQARHGKLKYGKLSPDQVQRVQERLLMEANTRKLGSAEKTWRQQKRDARRKGKLLGIEKGTAAAMEEVARAGANFGINGIKKMMSAKAEGTQERIKNRAKNKKTHADMRREMREEAYKTKIRDVDFYKDKYNMPGIHINANAAKYLKEKNAREEQKKLEANRQQLLDDAYRKLILGDKKSTVDDVKEALKNRDDIYRLVYGKESPKEVDNPGSSGKEKTKYEFDRDELFGDNSNVTALRTTHLSKAYDNTKGKVIDYLDPATDLYKKLDVAGRKAYRRHKQKKQYKKDNDWVVID